MVETVILFGVGASIFFTGAVFSLLFAVQNGSLRSPFYFLPPLVSLIAGVAYVGMFSIETEAIALGANVELLRFADWAVTTPLITYYLGRLAGVEQSIKAAAVVANVFMISLGYLFVAVSGTLQWVAFGASMICFIAIIYLFVQTFGRALVGASQVSRSLFISLRDLTVATWLIYPVVYFLGPIGLEIIQPADMTFIIMALDVTAKVGLISIILFRQHTLKTYLSYDIPSPSGD